MKSKVVSFQLVSRSLHYLFESFAFHEPLQSERQVAYLLPANCSIAEAKRIAYGEFLATSHAMDLQAEKIRLRRFKNETSFDAFL